MLVVHNRTGPIRDEGAVALYGRIAVSHPDERRREQAVHQLGRLGLPSAVPHLIPLLSSRQKRIEKAARDAVERLVGRDLGENLGDYWIWCHEYGMSLPFPEEDASPELKAKADPWIARLADPDWKKRDEATQALVGMGAKIMGHLLKTVRTTDDPETKNLCSLAVARILQRETPKGPDPFALSIEELALLLL